MADTSTSSRAPGAHPSSNAVTRNETFDPADWLARYTALGGVYVANGKLNLCILVNQQSEDELSQIRQMVADLTDADKAAILAHLKAIEAGAPMGWQEVVAKYEADTAALSAHPYSRMLASDPGHDQAEAEANALGVLASKSLAAMIAAPAPTFSAMRQKLDIIGAEYAGFDELTGIVAAIANDLDRLTARPVGADREILDAWDRRRAAYERYNALPITKGEAPDYMSPAERAEWDIIDTTEEIIRAAVATTPRGAATQLWVSLQHSITSPADEAACMRRDVSALQERDEALDWTERLVLAALRSLETMEG